MNKNKLIFAIIGIILLIGLIIMALKIKDPKTNQGNNGSGTFSIWMVGDNKEGTSKVIEKFKELNPEYTNYTITVENFSSYDDYYYALSSAIISEKAPDIFVLNNNEKESIFANQIIGINPTFISPNDFRKKYKGFFADDLIVSSGEGEEKQEFLKGIPVGYESLGIFFNRRYVKDSDLSSISSLNNLIAELKEKNPEVVPIGIGNGSTVEGVSDIITQFFMLGDGVTGLKDVVGPKMKEGLSGYMLYGDSTGYNKYNSKFSELSNLGNTSIDLFSRGETFMVVGYPRLINLIKEKGFSKNFLLASPFPHYFSGSGKSLVNYDYFVINKDSTKRDLANAFLGFLSSDIGAEEYLNNYKYYLPALLSLEADKLEDKINDDFNIVLGDFFSSDYEFSSFDKGVKNIYDKNIIPVLDNTSNYENAFDKFRISILCKANKISTLQGLSQSCD